MHRDQGTAGGRAEGIRRRDFLNGILLAAGGAAVGSSYPLRVFAQDGGVPINSDPRALRGGDLPSVFRIGHWMRDDRLTFTADTVHLAPTSRDPQEGDFPIQDDGERYDAVIVGSGMAGLSAAFFVRQRRPGTRVLLLDAAGTFGGVAARDDGAPIPVVAGTGGAYAVTPYAEFLNEIYGTSGIDCAANYVADPFYSYFFDDRTPYVLPGTRSWNLDTYGRGLQNVPYPDDILRDLHKAKQDLRNWYCRAGSPTDPADNGDPKYDYLAHMTFDQYLTGTMLLHPAVSDFYTRYAVDALAGTTKQVGAYTAISFLGAEYYPVMSFPGGTSAIARHILRWLVPGAIDGSSTAQIIANPVRADLLDAPGNAVRVRQGAMAVRADTGSSDATVLYYKDGAFRRVRGSAVILAGQSHTAHHIVEHLLNAETLEAWEEFTLVPVVTANVTLRRAAPLVDLGLGYNSYWWGSQYWADFVIADWVTPNRHDRERSTVLTFYGANTYPPEEMASERGKLMRTPFSTYEQSLREDLNRILAPAGFDFDRDVNAVYLYRWGHGMIYPKPGFAFGVPQGSPETQVTRTPAARHVARRQIGRISFAAQDTESSPAIESAIGSGLRAAQEVLPLL